MSPHGVFGAWGELRKHGFLIGVIAVCNGIVPALVSCLHWYRACTGALFGVSELCDDVTVKEPLHPKVLQPKS